MRGLMTDNQGPLQGPIGFDRYFQRIVLSPWLDIRKVALSPHTQQIKDGEISVH
jgi:hypothetical protein